MATILDTILEAKRAQVAQARRDVPLDDLRRRIGSMPAARDFYGALAVAPRHLIHLIAEVKHKSPSAGAIVADFDPVRIARQYYEAGVSALSVLTDAEFFGGQPEHLAAVKAAVPLPVLRKDFILEEYQVYESRCLGADAILLIAEAIGAKRIAELADLATELGLSALIEVHREDLLAEVLSAVSFAPDRRRLLGINNRDLSVQQTDLSTTGRLIRQIPQPRPLVVSESGIRSHADVQRLAADGARAVLVGESLLRSPDIPTAVGALLGRASAGPASPDA